MNLYWPVYKRIEEEVLALADTIHFSDDQLSVYSVKIADLIIRCAIEIESISKDLYCQLDGDMNPKDNDGNNRDLYFDTDCIKLINEKWYLDKKGLSINASNMYFNNSFELYPLNRANRRGSSGPKWKRAYQALKHDRYKSLKQGNILNLLNALGALYILNIYYADESYDAGLLGIIPLQLESTYSSKVFEATYTQALEIKWEEEVSDDNIVWSDEEKKNLEKAIYIVKVSNEDLKTQHYEWSYVQRKRQLLFQNNEHIKKYIKKHPECSEWPMEQICIFAGGLRLANEIMGTREIDWVKRPLIEVMVNKNRNIYPHLPIIDVNHIDEMIADYFYYLQK